MTSRRALLALLAALPFVRWLRPKPRVYVWDGRDTFLLDQPYEALAWEQRAVDRWIDLAPNDGRFHVLQVHRRDGVTTTYVNGERVS